jgi:hypothetical protein
VIDGPLKLIYNYNLYKVIPDEYWQQIKNPKSPNITIYYGVEGLTTPGAFATNNMIAYPLVKHEDKAQ